MEFLVGTVKSVDESAMTQSRNLSRKGAKGLGNCNSIQGLWTRSIRNHYHVCANL